MTKKTYFIVVGAIGALLYTGELAILAHLHAHDGVHVEAG